MLQKLHDERITMKILRVDDLSHRRLKMMAAQRGVTLQSLVTEAIDVLALVRSNH